MGTELIGKLKREQDLAKNKALREEARKALGALTTGAAMASLPSEAWEGEREAISKAALGMCAEMIPEKWKQPGLRDMASRALEADAAAMLLELGKLGLDFESAAPSEQSWSDGWRGESWRMGIDDRGSAARLGWIDECLTRHAWKCLDALGESGALKTEIERLNRIWCEPREVASWRAKIAVEGWGEEDAEIGRAELEEVADASQHHPLLRAAEDDEGHPAGLMRKLLGLGVKPAEKSPGFRLATARMCLEGNRDALRLAERMKVGVGEFGSEICKEMAFEALLRSPDGQGAGRMSAKESKSRNARAAAFLLGDEKTRGEIDRGRPFAEDLLERLCEEAEKAASGERRHDVMWGKKAIEEWVWRSREFLGEEPCFGVSKLAEPGKEALEAARSRMTAAMVGVRSDITSMNEHWGEDMPKERGSLKEAAMAAIGEIDKRLGGLKPSARIRKA